jgi:hypothetical protein
MGDLSNFERGQIVDACLAGTSVTKTATLLGVLRVTVSKLMLAYMNHGKITSAKRNRHHHTFRRTVLNNHRTTAAQVTAELNIHLEDSVSTKSL